MGLSVGREDYINKILRRAWKAGKIGRKGFMYYKKSDTQEKSDGTIPDEFFKIGDKLSEATPPFHVSGNPESWGGRMNDEAHADPWQMIKVLKDIEQEQDHQIEMLTKKVKYGAEQITALTEKVDRCRDLLKRFVDWEDDDSPLANAEQYDLNIADAKEALANEQECPDCYAGEYPREIDDKGPPIVCPSCSGTGKKN